MRIFVYAITLAALFGIGPAHALTIEAVLDGPLMKRERVVEFVRDRAGGAVAQIPDVEQGGKYRLLVRVSSQPAGSPSRFLCLVEFELQRQVIEQDTGYAYWAMIHSTTAWGTVPSETELWKTIGELVGKRVNSWVVD
ncbi:MAG TPA: hypothetical protein VMP00_15485 [Burkholderiales bacterium]|nr:hypothetical protein [Burkholderiales bacterium]